MNSRYVLERKLGSGGMGVVYTAQDRLTGEIVALKRVILSPDKTSQDSDTFLTALATEFRTMAGLHHPHIVRVLDYGFTFETGFPQPYFTMEYLPGARPITKAAADQPLATQVRLLTEMLMALSYLHRHGVIHRDLKPDNVLVDSSGRVKVLDFGLALIAAGRSSDRSTQEPVGTMAYMAPELFAEEIATAQSDLYAAGLLMYEVFARQFPYNQKNLMLLVQNILNHIPDVSMFDSRLGILLSLLLAKDPSMRFGNAETVIQELSEATGQPIPSETTEVRESFLQASRFVGRDSEIDQLKIALDSMFAAPDPQTAQIYLIGGESGVGKSRLLDELRIRALIRGARTLRGQGVAEGGLPYQLWRMVARELVLTTPLNDLEASVLKEIVPDIDTLLDRDVDDAPELSGSAGQRRLVLTLVDILKRQTQPLVLLLEDLQWAEESLSPIKQILTIREQLPHLLVIGTYRDDERPDLPDRFPGAETIKLSRLNEAAISELAQSMLGEAGTRPQVLELLKRETEGNAFFMVETVRALAEEAGALSEVGRATLPKQIFAGGVQQIVRRRLNRVPDAVRPFLNQVAVAGRWLDLKLLATLTAPENLETFLTTCANAGVLEIVEGRWRFNHDKLREALLGELDVMDSRPLHRAVAGAIEAVYPDDETYHEVLLEHWRAAGDPVKEVFYLVAVVGDLVNVRNEYNRAIQLAEQGLSLPEATSRRPRLLNLLALANSNKGQYEAALDWIQQARQAAEQIGDRQNVADSIRHMGTVISSYQGDFAAAQAHFQQSLEISRELNNRNRIAENLMSLGSCALYQGNFAVATDYYQQSMAAFEALNRPAGIANTMGNIGLIFLSQGEPAAASEKFQQSLDISRAIGNRQSIMNNLSHLGLAKLYQGDFAAASSHFQEAIIESQELDNRSSSALNMTYLGIAELEQGNLTVAAFHLREGLAKGAALNIKPIMIDPMLNLARVHLKTGNPIFAAEITALIAHYPVMNTEQRDKEVSGVRIELAAVLPVDELEAAWERGKSLDFDATVQKLIESGDTP